MREPCKFCGTSFFKIVKKKETYINKGQKTTHYWIGCEDCWDRLQKYVG